LAEDNRGPELLTVRRCQHVVTLPIDQPSPKPVNLTLSIAVCHLLARDRDLKSCSQLHY
jgi:hypothetical protein